MADTPETRPSGIAPSADRAGRPAATSGGVGRSTSASSRKTSEEAKRQANRLASEAKQRGRSMIDQQKGNAANQLSGIASALRQTASQCAEREDQRTTGRALEQAASGLERFAETLRNRDVDSLFDQAATMVRRQPALFIGGTIAVGFLLSRFAKSSAERSSVQYVQSYDDEAYEGYETDLGTSDRTDTGSSYVTSAHVNPSEVAASSRPVVPPVTPTGRRDL